MTAQLEHKTALPLVPSINVSEDDDDGTFTALVAVTGVRDNVNDIIVPGAFAGTLAERLPKGVHSHDDKVWTARTLVAEEWMPGDPRLPQTTRDGKPWPREAGAVYVKGQFNLATDEGKRAYENVKFFRDQCEWSIGYAVVPGKSKRDSKGVRHIHQLALFEYSTVLVAANPLAMTLSVKSQFGSDPADDDMDDVVLPIEAKAGVPGVADTPSDEASVNRLRRWYSHGEGAIKIRWGQPGDFDRCVRLASRHMDPEKAKGFCANRHHEALGVWPGREHGKKGGGLDGFEVKADPQDADLDDTGDTADDTDDRFANSVMVALILPAEVAEQIALPGGLEPSDLHVTLAYLGDGLDPDTVELATMAVEQAATLAGPLAGRIGGVGAFPPDPEDGTPVFATVDVPGLEVLRQHVVDALDAAGVDYAANHGYTPHVTLTYAQDGDPLPAPLAPIPVEFGEVVVAVGDDHTPLPLTGTPETEDTEMETETVDRDETADTGDVAPGEAEEKADPRDTVPGWEGTVGPGPGQYGDPHVYARDVTSGAGNCVCGAPLADPIHVQAAPGVPVPDREAEEKGDPRVDMLRAAGAPIPLSYEEVRDRIRDGMTRWASAAGVDRPWVAVHATFPTHAIVAVESAGPIDGSSGDTFVVPYEIGPRGVVHLGEPQPVVVSVTAPAGASVFDPAADLLTDTMLGLKALLGGSGVEVKAGRVLSDRNAKRITTAILTLLSIFHDAGIDIAVPEPDDKPGQDADGLPAEATIKPDSTAPSAQPDSYKTLSVAEYLAGVEAINAALEVIA